MSRIAPLSKPFSDDVRRSFDQIMPPGVEPLVLFTTLAKSERAWKKFRSASLLDRGPLSLRQREIAINRICARNECEYKWGVHVTTFKAAAKLTDAQVAATYHSDARDLCWTPSEQALISAIDALEDRSTLSAAEFSSLAAHFNEDQIFEILLLAGFYKTVSYIANALDLPLEAGTARFGVK